MAELPRIKVVAVHQTGGWLPNSTLPGDLQMQVVVMNPSEEVYEQLRHLVDTDAIIQLGAVPA